MVRAGRRTRRPRSAATRRAARAIRRNALRRAPRQFCCQPRLREGQKRQVMCGLRALLVLVLYGRVLGGRGSLPTRCKLHKGRAADRADSVHGTRCAEPCPGLGMALDCMRPAIAYVKTGLTTTETEKLCSQRHVIFFLPPRSRWPVLPARRAAIRTSPCA